MYSSTCVTGELRGPRQDESVGTAGVGGGCGQRPSRTAKGTTATVWTPSGTVKHTRVRTFTLP